MKEQEVKQQVEQLRQNIVSISTDLLRTLSSQEIVMLSKKMTSIFLKCGANNVLEIKNEQIMKQHFQTCITRVGAEMNQELRMSEEKENVRESFVELITIFNKYFQIDQTTCYQDFIGRSIEDILTGVTIGFEALLELKTNMRSTLEQDLKKIVSSTRKLVQTQFINKISIEPQPKKAKKKLRV